jgi:hypothetical protein
VFILLNEVSFIGIAKMECHHCLMPVDVRE